MKDIFLVLIDDGSTDGTSGMVKSMFPNSHIIYGNGNLWWGGALDLGYKYVASVADDNDIVFIANDDTDFTHDYFTRAISIISRNTDCLLTGCGISKQTGNRVDGAVSFDFIKGGGEVSLEDIGYGNCASTRSLFIYAKHLRLTGGFHPKLLPHYGSDYEWTIRACRKNKIKVLCDSTLWYIVNEDTTGDHSKNKRSIKQILSKKSVSNPMYKISFCMLAAPVGLKIASIMGIGVRLVKH